MVNNSSSLAVLFLLGPIAGILAAYPCSTWLYTKSSGEWQESGLDVSDASEVAISVMACDASLALHTEFSEPTASGYIIDFSGNNTAAATIKKDGVQLASSSPSKASLECTSYKDFVVSWASGVISLRDSASGDILITVTDPSPITVKYVSMTSGEGTDGHWNVQGDCRSAGDCLADVGIVLDVSKSITPTTWNTVTVPIFHEFMDRFNETAAGVKVGVVAFNDTSYFHIALASSTDIEAVTELFESSVVYHKGPTCIGCGLADLRENLFTEMAGDRPDVTNYGIIVSDGVPTIDKRRFEDEANQLMYDGVVMFSIAVEGMEKADLDALTHIAVNSSRLFTSSNRAQAGSAVVNIFNTICPPYVDPCEVNPCENGGVCVADSSTEGFFCECPTGYAGVRCHLGCFRVDLVVILDSSSSIKRTRWDNIVLPTIQAFVHHYAVGQDQTRVGSVSFSESSEVDFYLNTHDDAASLDEAISQLDYHKSRTCIACGLRTATDEVFKENAGDRPDVPNVVMVFTDGKSNIETDQVQYESDRLKSEADALVFVMAVTGGVNRTECNIIASDPDDEFVLPVASFTTMLASAADVAALSCAQVSQDISKRSVDSYISPAEKARRSSPVDEMNISSADKARRSNA